MKIQIKLIGRYKEMVGSSSLELDIGTGETLWHVVDVFIKKYPVFVKDKKFMMVSKNGVLSGHETRVGPDDEVTLAPPVVSGG